MKPDILKIPLGAGVAATISRRDGPRFMLERLVREIEAADAADRHALESAVGVIDREGLTDRQIEALIGALTGTQARLLLRLTQVGLAATQGPKATTRAERVRELRAWLEATHPDVRTVAELRALPGFPKAAKRLADRTLRRRLSAAGIALRGGRPSKNRTEG